MIIVSSREFRDNQKKFFDLAEVQRVIIKRKKQFLELVPRGNVIPENVSPSKDSYFDNSRNIADIDMGIQQAEEGKTIKLTQELRDELFNNL